MLMVAMLMSIWVWVQHAAEQASAPVVAAQQSAPNNLTYQAIIGALGGFILMLIAWVKSLIDQKDKIQNERISDLKDQFRSVK